jgi:nucleoid DNA-binding protein
MPATKVFLVEEIQGELKDFQVTKSAVKAFLAAQQKVLERNLKRDRVVRIPGIIKIKLVNVPPKPERRAKNPSTGKPMVVAAKPATKKLKGLFLTEFKIAVGATGSKSVQQAIERREANEPVRARIELRKKALSKLTTAELEALGLGNGAGLVPGRRKSNGKPQATKPEVRSQVTQPEVVTPTPGGKQPDVLVDRMIYVIGHDTLKFEDVCKRLEAFGWMPKRRSSVSNVLSAKRDVFESPSHRNYRVATRVIGPLR